MAKQIEGVAEKIEKCAREEFLKNGYTDASLRTIASEAGTTTGSIYSRYGDKEGLFSAIVEPAANEFIEKFRSIQEEFHSMESVGLDPTKRKHITKDFMHIMNKALFESFFEVIRHDMSKEEALEYVVMLEKYHNAGWNIIYDEYC